MTIRISDLTIAPDSTHSYVGHRPLQRNEIDVLDIRRHQASGWLTPMADRLVLSVVRYELGEDGHQCDRLPSVKGLIVTTEFDDYGRNIFADIEYDSHGHRATYGGRFDPATNAVHWTCYMD